MEASYEIYAILDKVLRVYKPSETRDIKPELVQVPLWSTLANVKCSERFFWAFKQFPSKLPAVALCFISQVP